MKKWKNNNLFSYHRGFTLNLPTAFIRIFLWLIWGTLPALAARETFPTPPESAIRLFYIQRSSNTNVVVYDANLTASKALNAKNPVHTYWIRYAEKGQQEELSSIQKTLAYGLYTNRIISETEPSYEGYFLAYRKRKFVVKLDPKGSPIALFPINGRLQVLKRVFVSVDESKFMPSVNYIELFGKDPVSGKDVYERFKP
ncbi:DUF4833 domain-containing protein [Aquirufa aurantiipilula]|uniref:DUF4833 domain-containing protein n=1 Tax=Aquirufa aurantiipilula TaxID=2696561 RepID=A0ABT6BGV3_9BACT|nr:DUF4833 domain-containing protein [Aquirufa aurantiipilula]MDF5689509.1 DUF4833 domain-containing protein [Aquirufa aurantiipilula]